KALERATGERVDTFLSDSSSIDAIRKTYDRVANLSLKLKEWLSKFMPMYEQLEADRAKDKSDPNSKRKVVAIDSKLNTDPDLSALKTLIAEYTKPTVQAWLAYGIITVPAEVIELF